MIDPAILEGIADGIHALGLREPIDAFDVAAVCDVEIVHTLAHAERHGDVIEIPGRSRHTRQQYGLAHELAHWLLEDEGLNAFDEEAADYLACALLMPRVRFSSAFAIHGANLEALRELYPNVPASRIAARICHVAPATATVWDQWKLTRSYVSANWLLDVPTDRLVVGVVLQDEQQILSEEYSAWPLFDGRNRRVIVVRNGVGAVEATRVTYADGASHRQGCSASSSLVR